MDKGGGGNAYPQNVDKNSFFYPSLTTATDTTAIPFAFSITSYFCVLFFLVSSVFFLIASGIFRYSLRVYVILKALEKLGIWLRHASTFGEED